ncbi:type II secretion system minor pseudopilin GspK [Pseudoteredinibacter isoporae]|uniref:General secretion pathway protein K n=1 Tax=Pseudoteredinibacter isoporae TaxID=570281 RepID=A0A7X0MW64_9GAMM|nr:general secretion pathway protein K [Pseudoteredinibacter isoporae]NHO87409.1 type II secretion system minor pseudopilin GspK [Pseudoteredinibacter isoporae]NIB24260.1 type II secretion system minor pseudopilin GspK [Pseudoteredinibacter isoporae]
MGACRDQSRVYSQAGVALISMLLVLAIVTALCTQMLTKSRLELKRSEALIRTAQTEQMVFSGLAYGQVLVLKYTEKETNPGAARQVNEPSSQKEMGSGFENRSLAHLQIQGGAPLPEPEAGEASSVFVGPYWPFAGNAEEFSILIEDEQGKFNLNNLVNSNGKVNEAQLKVFQRILLALELEPELALYIADWIDYDRNPIAYNSEDFSYLQEVVAYRTANRPIKYWREIISVKGVSQEVLEQLLAYVTAIPGPSKVNVNSASSVLLEAMIPGLDGEALLESRDANGGYSSVSELSKSTLTAGLKMDANLFSVDSAFYAITAYCRFDGFESSWQILSERVEAKKKNKKPQLHTLWKRQLPFWELGLTKMQKIVDLENE